MTKSGSMPSNHRRATDALRRRVAAIVEPMLRRIVGLTDDHHEAILNAAVRAAVEANAGQWLEDKSLAALAKTRERWGVRTATARAVRKLTGCDLAEVDPHLAEVAGG